LIRFLLSTEVLPSDINLPVLFGAAGLEERFGSACLDRLLQVISILTSDAGSRILKEHANVLHFDTLAQFCNELALFMIPFLSFKCHDRW